MNSRRTRVYNAMQAGRVEGVDDRALLPQDNGRGGGRGGNHASAVLQAPTWSDRAGHALTIQPLKPPGLIGKACPPVADRAGSRTCQRCPGACVCGHFSVKLLLRYERWRCLTHAYTVGRTQATRLLRFRSWARACGANI